LLSSSGEVKVTIRYAEGEAPESLAITAANDQQALTLDSHTREGREGYLIRLPAGKTWQLTFAVPGCVAQRRTLELKPGTARESIELGNWVKQARLKLILPPQQPIQQIQIIPQKSKAGDKVDVITLDEKALAGKSEIEVAIEPDRIHDVIARARGCRDFLARKEIPPGDSRSIPIFFQEGPVKTP
jgi:hypothetical protein